MNYKSMLERMSWDGNNVKNDIQKIERITDSLRINLSKKELTESIKKQYYDYWRYIAEKNCFICTLLFKREERIHGINDICTEQCFLSIKAELSQLHIEDDTSAGWHLLAEIEMQNNKHIIDYVRYLSGGVHFKKYIKLLQNTSCIADSVSFLIRSCCVADNELRKTVIGAILACRWTIDINDMTDSSSIEDVVKLLWTWNDIPNLIEIIGIFENITFLQMLELNISECREHLLTQKQPLSMILYRKILQKENLTTEEVINHLYKFTYCYSNSPSTIVNDYLFFSYAVAEFPEQYDKYDMLLDHYKNAVGDSFNNVICFWNDFLEADSGRWYNYLLVEKPFLSLIRMNPSKVDRFLDRMSSISLYDSSRSLVYRKNQTWIPNNNLKEYIQFLSDYSSIHSKSETLSLYMRSPLKAQIDFSYLLRLLFQPDEGFVYLSDALDKYVLRGKVIKKPTAEKDRSYQVSVSNAASSYRFPIHHSWMKDHYEEVDQLHKDDIPVYFKVMSLNSKGMIFVHDLVRKPRSEKSVSKVETETKTKVLKYLEKIIDGTLGYQGNNSSESIRLFALAMICDDENRILVERKQDKECITDSLPFIQVSNCETTDDSIRRLMKYSLGFRGDLALRPCGIRHLCIGRKERSIVFIYKILLSDCREKQNSLILKPQLIWRNIDEYRENATEKTSVSILNTLDTSWSESIINL